MISLEEIIQMYAAQEISLGTAAKLARMSVSDFIGKLSEKQVSVFQYSPEEVLEEVGRYDT